MTETDSNTDSVYARLENIRLYLLEVGEERAVDFVASCQNTFLHNGDDRGLYLAEVALAMIAKVRDDYDVMEAHCDRAMDIARRLADPRLVLECRLNRALVFAMRGELDRVEEESVSSLTLAEKLDDPKLLWRVATNLARVYMHKMNPGTAFEWFLRALEYAKKNGSATVMAASYLNLGVVNADNGRFESAAEYFRHALSFAQGDDPVFRLNVLMNIGLVQLELGDYDSAIEHLHEVLSESERWSIRKSHLQALVNLSGAYVRMGNHAEAHLYAKRSLVLARELGDLYHEGMALFNVGSALHKLGGDAEACDYYRMAIEVSSRAGDANTRLFALVGLLQSSSLDDHEAITKLVDDSQRVMLFPGIADSAKMEIEVRTVIAAFAERVGDWRRAFEETKKITELVRKQAADDARLKTSLLEVEYRLEDAKRKAEISHLQNIELKEANRRLEQLNEEKNHLLAVAAHDLRNPLSSILTSLTVLSDAGLPMAPKEREHLIQMMIETSRRALNTLSDLLDLRKFELRSFDLQLSAFDLSDTLQVLSAQYEALAEMKKIRIDLAGTDSPVDIYSDHDLLIRVVENLLSNAIKYSPPGSVVSMSLSVSTEDASAAIRVADQGPGFAKEDYELLFKRFVRLSARPTADEPSSGLGLAIVRETVETLGGEVTLLSRPGESAVFRVILPLVHPKAN